MIRLKNHLVLIFISLCFLSCQMIEIQKKPNSLNECYKLLNKIFNEKEKNRIINASNDLIMNEYHFGIGLYIRNNWIRHGDSNLVKQINYKPWKISIDDLSDVILKGYWNYLHKIEYKWEFDLEKAEEYYRKENNN